jgi:chromosomal replication initiator protein
VQPNPNYTFDDFAIGSGNRFAHAECQAVARHLSKAYNPLFLWGDAGVGKTHLMHAMGHEIKRCFPQATICYVSSEKFIEEMIHSLRYDKRTTFAHKFRNLDVLLVDDVQYLQRRERTQEEFFHTFNALRLSGRQIVLASNRPPKYLRDLDNGLLTRFESGLIADIEPPDFETKIAILRKKAEKIKLSLPDDVAIYIASNTRPNGHTLEGALIRLAAHSSLSGAEVTVPYAQGLLKNSFER